MIEQLSDAAQPPSFIEELKKQKIASREQYAREVEQLEGHLKKAYDDLSILRTKVARAEREAAHFRGLYVKLSELCAMQAKESVLAIEVRTETENAPY